MEKPLCRTLEEADQMIDGVVTLSARGPDPHDGYGYEFDLSPQAALLLASRLTVAAAGASRSKAPR